MKRFLGTLAILACSAFAATAQEDACSKCEMLREECEVSVSPHKEEVCAFFRQECLQTDTVFVADNGAQAEPKNAAAYQVVDKGTCIDYKMVKEYEKKSNREVRAFQVSKADTVYQVAGTAPEFKGGEDALIMYLAKNVKYPAAAREAKLQGTVYVRCVISKTGAVASVKSARGPSEDLKTEAERVIKSMPAWNPATFRKQPVSMAVVIPVRFALR